MEFKKIEKKIVSKVSKTIRKYELISPNDKIIVGLSGGKDSLVLIKLLSQLRRHMPFSFDILAVFVNIKVVSYSADIFYLDNYCQSLDIPFVHHLVENDLDIENSKKGACFTCSWSRRKSLFTYAKENKYNKLALGHHLDDAVETLLMNMVYHANISSLPPILSMFDGELTIIRPLIEVKEDLIIQYAQHCNFKPMVKSCPFEKESSRQFSKEILQKMDDRYDRSKNNIFASMSNIDSKYLPK